MTVDLERIRKAFSTAIYPDTPPIEASAAWSGFKRLAHAAGWKSLEDVISAFTPPKDVATFLGKDQGWKDEPFGWNQVIPFGKHSGEELGEIAREDPDYIVWLHGQELRSPSLRRAVASVHEWLEEQ